jgi:hypothetical protein
MKRSSRSFLILSLMTVALLTSRCDCGSRVGNSSGRCEGAIGGLRVSDAIDDSDSFFFVDNFERRDVLSLSYGGRKVAFSVTTSPTTVLSGGVELKLPGEVPLASDGGRANPDAGTGWMTEPGSPEIRYWSIDVPPPGSSRPLLSGGTLERTLSVSDDRVVGTLKLQFEDGTALTCDFALRHDKDQDVDAATGGCLGGGGGGSDFD